MVTSVRLTEKLKERIEKIMPEGMSFSKKMTHLVEKGLEFADPDNLSLEDKTFYPDTRIISQKVDLDEEINLEEITYLISEIYYLFSLAHITPSFLSCEKCSNFVNQLFIEGIFPLEKNYENYLRGHIPTEEYTSIQDGVSKANREIISQESKISPSSRAFKAENLMRVLYVCLREYRQSLNVSQINKIIKPYLPFFLAMVKYKTMKSDPESKPTPHYLSKKEFVDSINYQRAENDLVTEKYHIFLDFREYPSLIINFKIRDIMYFFSYLEMIDLLNFSENYEEAIETNDWNIMSLKGEKISILAESAGDSLHTVIFSGVTMFFEGVDMREFFTEIRRFVKKNENIMNEIKFQMGAF